MLFAGESIDSKLKRIRKAMSDFEASTLLVSKLDEIAWTLNLRGADEDSSPVFISYLMITPDSADLYVDPAKITEEVEAYLKAVNITVKPYEEATEGLKRRLSENNTSKVWLDAKLVNEAIFVAAREALGEEVCCHAPNPDVNRYWRQSDKLIVRDKTPLTSFMSIKNPLELNGMREAHIRDATAVIEFLSWLDEEIASGRTLTEVDVDIEITARRAKQKGFKGVSFPTIAGLTDSRLQKGPSINSVF